MRMRAGADVDVEVGASDDVVDVAAYAVVVAPGADADAVVGARAQS